jgi:peptide/nickel transport system substrate-binding protein
MEERTMAKNIPDRTDQQDVDPGQAFDQRMAAYLTELRAQAMSRRGFLRFSATAGAAAAVGLAGGATAEARPFLPGLSVLQQDGGSLTFGLEGDVRGLEPALSYDFTANPVVCQISEGLLMFDAKGALQPLLAEKWEQPDPLTYIYTLRQGLTFHDGSPVTVDDVVASIARVRDAEVAGPLAWMYDTPGATVERTDDKTITIKLKTASALFQYVPATTAGHVIPKAAIDKFGLDLLRNPIGTGPYTFVKWDAGSQIELKKNPEYWQEGKPAFETVVFKIIEEGTTRVTALKNGEINAMTAVPPDQIDVVKGFDTTTFQEVVGYTINGIVLRTDKPPFDDVKIRQAVNYAVDIDAIMTNIVKETGVRSRNTPVPPDMPGSAAKELEPIPYDLEKAKQLMAESSQPDGFKTKLSVIAPSDIWVPQAIAVQEALKELKIEVEIDQLPYADIITLQQAGDYEGMMSFQWGSDFPDAAGNLIPLFSSKNFPPQNNHAFYKDESVDAALDASEAELDPEKRRQLLVDAQKTISAAQPWIFFEHFKWYLPITKGLTGYQVTALWYWDGFTRDLKPADV